MVGLLNQKIVTGPDRLLELVAARKQVSLSNAADLLHTTHKSISKWADYLEDAGLICKKIGFKETLLMTNDHFDSNNNPIQDLLAQARHLLVRSKSPEEKQLDSKLFQIEKRKKSLSLGLHQMRMQRQEINDLRAKLAKEKDYFVFLKRKLDNKTQIIRESKAELEKRHLEITEKALELRSRFESHNMKERDLVKRAGELDKKEKQLQTIEIFQAKQKHIIKKEHKILTEKKSELKMIKAYRKIMENMLKKENASRFFTPDEKYGFQSTRVLRSANKAPFSVKEKSKDNLNVEYD